MPHPTLLGLQSPHRMRLDLAINHDGFFAFQQIIDRDSKLALVFFEVRLDQGPIALFQGGLDVRLFYGVGVKSTSPITHTNDKHLALKVAGDPHLPLFPSQISMFHNVGTDLIDGQFDLIKCLPVKAHLFGYFRQTLSDHGHILHYSQYPELQEGVR